MARARNRALPRELYREADRIFTAREGTAVGRTLSCAGSSETFRGGGATEAPSVRDLLRAQRSRLTPPLRAVLDRTTLVMLEILWLARC